MVPPAAVPNLKVLEQWQVSPSPAPSTATPSCLPLTFFDLVFWNFPPVKRLFFYDCSALSVAEFLCTALPRLKESLAIALHYFYPLAGKITCKLTDDARPEIVCSESDSVLFALSVSGDDFSELAGDHARETARFRPLLPPLLGCKDSGRRAVLAIQVTLFPNAGVGIGTTMHHAVADGSSYTHFMKTWAAIHRDRGLGVAVPDVLPLFDRGTVRDPEKLWRVFASDLQSLDGDRRIEAWDLGRRHDVVMATFRFTGNQLHKLRRHVETKTSARCSPYALACGATWAGIVRVRDGGGGKGNRMNAHFGFVTGCRPRVSPPIPANYFGNCLGICRVEAKTSDIAGGDTDSVAAASKAIWKVIEGLAVGGSAMQDPRRWLRDVYECASLRAVTVAGSPKLGVYGVEFGWGRPRKVEIVSAERTGALALAESPEDDGGIEVGLALPAREMEAFDAFYYKLLASL